MKKLLLLSILFIPWLSSSTKAEVKNEVSVSNNGSKVNVKINNEVNTSNSTNQVLSETTNSNSNTNISIKNNGSEDTQVKVENDDFEISGKVQATFSNGANISGQNVYNDTANVSNFVVGDLIHVKGKVSAGKFYATLVDKKISTQDNPSAIIKNEKNNNTSSPEPITSPSPPDGAVFINNEQDELNQKNLFQKIIDDLEKMIEKLKSVFNQK